MDNPEILATEEATRNGQSRDTGNRRGNQEWTIQRHWQPKGQPGMDNPETLATEEATRNGQSRDTGNTRYKTKTNNAQNTTQKINKISNTYSIK
jgi:hypothetical protein